MFLTSPHLTTPRWPVAQRALKAAWQALERLDNKGTMSSQSKKIACIGWGSLVWDPRTLPHIGDWSHDGPMLPVEFARESAGGKITLVICNDAARIPTLWTLLDVPDVMTARRQLGMREYESATQTWIETNIGFWDRSTGSAYGMETQSIANWADQHDLEGVVWTNLGYGFKDKARKGVMPSGEEIIAHLRDLEGKERMAAEEYICRAPKQIDTAYRRLIATTLAQS